MKCSKCGRKLTWKECCEVSKTITIGLLLLDVGLPDAVLCPKCSKKVDV